MQKKKYYKVGRIVKKIMFFVDTALLYAVTLSFVSPYCLFKYDYLQDKNITYPRSQ